MPPSASIDLPRRVFVTLLVVAALLAARQVVLPGLDTPAVAELGGHAFSVTVLGPMTWMTSFLFVEFGALTRARWRALRVGGPAERAQLEKATRWVWAALCCFQGFAIALSLEQVLTPSATDLVLSPGVNFRILTIVTLAAGSSLYWFGARIIDRWGFGNGFAVLVGLMLAESALPAIELASLFQDRERAALAPAVVVLALVAYGTWRLPTLWSSDGAVPLLSSGLGPVALVALPTLPHLILDIAPWSDTVHTLVSVGLVAVGSVVYAILFHLPWNVAPVAGRTVDEAEASLARTLPFAVLVTTGAAWATSSEAFGAGYLDVLALSLVCAHAWDLHVEWQARRAFGDIEVAWQLHRVYAVPPALRALEQAGIPTRVRGLRFRQLVHISGPYVPIELLVPLGRGAEARRVLEAGNAAAAAAA
ncbi:MAG: hypothetical protein V4850_36880 [Myxococcota bacterium]